MNNKEFIAQLARQTDSTQKQTALIVDTLTGIIAQNLKEGNDIQLGNIGTFTTKTKEQRIIINPKTKDRLLIPPKITAEYKPSRSIKDKYKPQ